MAVLGGVTGPFTQLFFLMGLENACITAYEDPELFHDIMRKCTYYNLNAGLECLAIGGPGGGYVLGSDHSLHDGIPVENIFTMVETGKKYGAYPIDPSTFPKV